MRDRTGSFYLIGQLLHPALKPAHTFHGLGPMSLFCLKLVLKFSHLEQIESSVISICLGLRPA